MLLSGDKNHDSLLQGVKHTRFFSGQSFRFNEIQLVSIDVAMCDLVQYVDTKHGLCYLLTTISGHLS